MTADRFDPESPAPPQRGLRIPIRLKLAAFVAAILLLSGVAVGVAALQVSEGMLYRQIALRLSAAAADRQRLLMAYVGQQHERTALVASRTRFRQLAAEFLSGQRPRAEFQALSKKILVDALRSTQGFQSIWLTNLQGLVITSTDDRQLGRDYSANAAFRHALQGPHFGKPFQESGRWRSYVATPAVADDGRRMGVVMVLLDVSPLIEFLSDTAYLGDSAEVLVGRPRADRVSYLLPPRDNPRLLEQPVSAAKAMARALQGQSGVGATTDYRGRRVLAAYRPVGYENWGLIAKLDADEAYTPISELRAAFLWLAVPVLLAGLAGAYLMARFLTYRIVRLTVDAMTVAGGDLDFQTELIARGAANDEIDDLTRAFATMRTSLRQQQQELQARLADEREARARIEQLTTGLKESLEAETDGRRQLQELVDTIQQAAGRLGNSAANIFVSVSRQSESAEQQSRAVAKTSETLMNVTYSAEQAAQLARQVAEEARRSLDAGRSSSESAQASVAAITRVGREFDSTSRSIQTLADRARAIGEIIDTVSEITDQTNMLALNAAIEAGRAGEQGKGIAVVAAEVKSLADRARESTEQIRQILREVQTATETCVRSTQTGNRSVNEANRVIAATAKTIEVLSQTIAQAATAGSQISTSAQQQASALSEINEAMNDFQQASADSLHATEQTEQSAHDLKALGESLGDLCERQTPLPGEAEDEGAQA